MTHVLEASKLKKCAACGLPCKVGFCSETCEIAYISWIFDQNPEWMEYAAGNIATSGVPSHIGYEEYRRQENLRKKLESSKRRAASA